LGRWLWVGVSSKMVFGFEGMSFYFGVGR